MQAVQAERALAVASGEAEAAPLEGMTRTVAARLAGAEAEQVPMAAAEWGTVESVLALWERGWATGTLGMKLVGL